MTVCKPISVKRQNEFDKTGQNSQINKRNNNNYFIK